MRIAALGRTHWLLHTIQALVTAGFEVPWIITAREAENYTASATDFEALASDIGAEFYQSGFFFRDTTALERLRAAQLDVAVSINWPNIIPESGTACFRHGIFNAHAGDLPRYRGNACPNWAILNGEDQIGLTLHQMMPGKLDSGDLALQYHYLLDAKTTIADVYAWMDAIIPDAFTTLAQRLQAGSLTLTPQSTVSVRPLRVFPRRPEDAKIDWQQSADQINRLIRASSQPFAGAFCFDDLGRKVTVWHAEPVTVAYDFCAIPGQIMERHSQCLLIACGVNTVLALHDYQLHTDDGIMCDSFEAASQLAKNFRARLT